MSSAFSVQALQEVITALIAPDGCPWDREQTPDSLCEYVLEEAHELVDAIRHGSKADVNEELGDVLFLLVFISVLNEKHGGYSFADAVAANSAKMVRRHPHVFAGAVFDSKEEQLAEWERIKRAEHPDEQGRSTGVFDSLPKSLPPLIKAYRIHSKAARAGFTWDSDEDVEMQVEAEWLEFIDAIRSEDKEAQGHEFGDLLFSLVELGRRKGIKASAAVDAASHRFLNRFTCMEDAARSTGRDFTALSMDEKNALWDKAKEEERRAGQADDDK